MNVAKEWGRSWHLIENSINGNLASELNNKFSVLNKKMDNLATNQTEKNEQQNNFYPRVVNKINIIFSKGTNDIL
jgi:hypothetical protein